MSLYECEHCGTGVRVSKVCPQCGRDHASWWINGVQQRIREEKEAENAQIEIENAKTVKMLKIIIIMVFIIIAYLRS